MAKRYHILNLKATGLLILRYSLIFMRFASRIIGWCFVGLDSPFFKLNFNLAFSMALAALNSIS
jgi:hypothetical protein